MPDVRMPDGTIMRNVPAGTPKSEIMARYNKANAKPGILDRVGDFAGKAISNINAAAVGVPEGISNLSSAISDPIIEKLITPFIGSERAAAERKAVEGSRGRAFDKWGATVAPQASPHSRTVGQIASTIPLGGAGIGGKALAAAPRTAAAANRVIQGAMGGAAVRDSGEGAGYNPVIGAGVNAVMPPAVGAALGYLGTRKPVQAAIDAVRPLAGKIAGAVDDMGDAAYGYLAPRLTPGKVIPKSLPRAPMPAPAASAPVREAFGRGADVRMNNFKKIGIDNPTTGMVTRDPRAWTFERETAKAAGVGDDLVGQFQEVSKGLERAAQGLVRGRNAPTDPEAVGIAVQKALDDKRSEMQRVTGALYTKVREERGDKAAGTIENFLDLVDAPDVTDNPTFDAIRTGIMRRLQRFGMAGESGLVRNGANISIGQAEELRKLVGGLGDGKDSAVRFIRGKLIDAIDDDVVEAVGDDAFKAARASARARFEEFGKTFSGKMADSAIAPEQVTQRIMGQGTRLSDVRSMRDSLLGGTPEQTTRGQQAWQGIGAQAMNDLFARSRMADGGLSGAQLGKNFASAGPKLRQILSPAEYKQLQRVVIAARDATTAPAFSAVNHSNTASAAANMFAPEAGGAPVWRRLLGNHAMHGAAYGLGGPAANIGLMAVEGATKSAAANRAAKAMLDKVELAKSPEAAARALAELQRKASRDAALRAAIKRWQDGGFYTFAQPGGGEGR